MRAFRCHGSRMIRLGGKKKERNRYQKERAPSESISMWRIENCALKKYSFWKKESPKRESSQQERLLNKRESVRRKDNFFCFFVPARATFRTKKKPKTLIEPPEVCGAVAIQKKKVKNNKREKRKYQKDYCTTRGVLCSKCNRRGRKGSEIKKKKSASYYITIQSHYSREFWEWEKTYY